MGSVRVPIIFNVYTNDKPIGKEIEHFIYADDLMAMAQDFETIENMLEELAQ